MAVLQQEDVLAAGSVKQMKPERRLAGGHARHGKQVGRAVHNRLRILDWEIDLAQLWNGVWLELPMGQEVAVTITFDKSSRYRWMTTSEPRYRTAKARDIDPPGQPDQHLRFKSRVTHAADGLIDRVEGDVERIERLPVGRRGDSAMDH